MNEEKYFNLHTNKVSWGTSHISARKHGPCGASRRVDRSYVCYKIKPQNPNEHLEFASCPTHHGRMSVAEGEARIREGGREAPQAPVVYGGQQAVHVGGALQTLTHSVATQDVDGLLQTVLHFTLLRKTTTSTQTSMRRKSQEQLVNAQCVFEKYLDPNEALN